MIRLCLVWFVLFWAVALASASRPVRALTPGVVAVSDLAAVCRIRATDAPVSGVQRALVFRLYGVPLSVQAVYALDFLVPISLGGANTVKNLWPQSTSDMAKKNVLEERLRRLVCVDHKLRVGVAQDLLRIDWTLAYRKYVGGRP